MIRFFMILLLSAVPAFAADIQSLEKTVVERAENDPSTAQEYFLALIENKPTPSSEEQAIYMFGIGVANEKLGDINAALSDYLAAEALGNKTASASAQRLQKNNGIFKRFLKWFD